MKSLLTVVVLLVFATSCLANDRQTACANSLDDYLATDISAKDLSHYLLFQCELTQYRIFGSFLAMRAEQTNAYKKGMRSALPVTRFSAMLQDHINYLEQTGLQTPDFLAAKASFDSAPLSLSTLAKLVPFIKSSTQLQSDIYSSGFGANYLLDSNDVLMLDLLATVDEQRENKRPANFINKIESLDATQISDFDVEENLDILNYEKIQESKKEIAEFLKSLEIPAVCAGEKVDIVNKLLTDTILARDDMKEKREERGSYFIYYTGYNSPWGSSEMGTFIP